MSTLPKQDHVLVLSPDKQIRIALLKHLQSVGHKYTGACAIASALEIIREYRLRPVPLSLIVVDTASSHEDAEKLYVALSKIELEFVPVIIVLTGRSFRIIRGRAIDVPNIDLKALAEAKFAPKESSEN